MEMLLKFEELITNKEIQSAIEKFQCEVGEMKDLRLRIEASERTRMDHL